MGQNEIKNPRMWYVKIIFSVRFIVSAENLHKRTNNHDYVLSLSYHVDILWPQRRTGDIGDATVGTSRNIKNQNET